MLSSNDGSAGNASDGNNLAKVSGDAGNVLMRLVAACHALSNAILCEYVSVLVST